MRRPHLPSLATSLLGCALLLGGCATPDAASGADPAAVSVPAADTTPVSASATDRAPSATDDAPSADPVSAGEPSSQRTDRPAAEVWQSRDLTRTAPPAQRSPAATPAPAPASTPAPAPSPTPVPAAPPAPVPPPAPPELVVGEDGCVTDLTTGLVVTCHDPAAGPDDEPTPG